MSRWPSGIDAAFLRHEHEERWKRIRELQRAPMRPARILFDGLEFIVLPSGAMARVDGGDPGDEHTPPKTAGRG